MGRRRLFQRRHLLRRTEPPIEGIGVVGHDLTPVFLGADGRIGGQEPVGELQPLLAAPGHQGAAHAEVDVVAVQPHRRHPARRLGERVIAPVQRHSVDVGHHRISIAPHPVIGVRRHMHQMAGRRGQQGQLLAVGNGLVRVIRPLSQVDIEVDRARLVRVPGQRAFQQVHGARDGRISRLALVVPPFVGGQQPGVSGDVGDGAVVGVLTRDPVHALGEAVGPAFLRTRIALDQGVDHLPLHRRGVAGQTAGVARRIVRRLDRGLVLPAAVQIGANSPGLAPGAHAARRVQRPRLAKGPHRFGMLERPAQPHAVVEPGLSLGVDGIHLEPARPEPIDHDDVVGRDRLDGRAAGAADLRLIQQVAHGLVRRRVRHRHRPDHAGRQGRTGHPSETHSTLSLSRWKSARQRMKPQAASASQ